HIWPCRRGMDWSDPHRELKTVGLLVVASTQWELWVSRKELGGRRALGHERAPSCSLTPVHRACDDSLPSALGRQRRLVGRTRIRSATTAGRDPASRHRSASRSEEVGGTWYGR